MLGIKNPPKLNTSVQHRHTPPWYVLLHEELYDFLETTEIADKPQKYEMD